MAIFVFADKLRLLPSGGMYNLAGARTTADLIVHMILPTTVLGLVMVAEWSRFTRSSFLEVISQDYIRTARSKGLTGRQVLTRHAFPNAAVPLIALAGMNLPYLFSGALITESIFGWPGMGRLFIDSLNLREYPILMGMVMFTGFAVIFGNLLADVCMAIIDPRIRLE